MIWYCYKYVHMTVGCLCVCPSVGLSVSISVSLLVSTPVTSFNPVRIFCLYKVHSSYVICIFFRWSTFRHQRWPWYLVLDHVSLNDAPTTGGLVLHTAMSSPITGFEIVVCLLLGSRRRCRGIIGPLRTYRLNSQTRSWKTEREMRREQKYRITKKPSVATGTYVQFQITVTSGSFARPDFTDAVSTSLQYFTLITRSALY